MSGFKKKQKRYFKQLQGEREENKIVEFLKHINNENAYLLIIYGIQLKQ